MNKDIPTIELDSAKVLNIELCPKSLCIQNLDYNTIDNWLKNRAISDNRIYSVEIYESVGIEPGNYRDLMIRTRGLSVTDHYWIASSSDLDNNLRYCDISLYTNKLDKYMNMIALTGEGALARTSGILSGEFTGHGEKAKCYLSDGGIRYLCKVQDRNTTILEITCGYLTKIVGINSANYFYKRVENRDCCVCELLGNMHDNWEYAIDLDEYTRGNLSITIQDFSMKLFGKSYTDIIIFDALILNPRSLNDLAFVVASETGNILGIAPLYDFNRAFTADKNTKSNLMTNYNILDAGRYVYNKFGTNLKFDILLENTNLLPQEIGIQSFTNRLKYIIGHDINLDDCYEKVNI